jgi:hypothetical protein
MSVLEDAKRAVFRVGNGRGFVVKGRADERYVVAAAHCLPSFPPCALVSYTEERTYKSLIGALDSKQSVWAECLFVDPIGDIALLGPPDAAYGKQREAYGMLLRDARPLPVADAPLKGIAWRLSLDGRWVRCGIERVSDDAPLWISTTAAIESNGDSGSPIGASYPGRDRQAAWPQSVAQVSRRSLHSFRPGGPLPINR